MDACYQNYYPRKLHRSGLKSNAYVFTRTAIVFANGRTYTGTGTGDGRGPTPARFDGPVAVNVPGCGCVGCG